MARRARHRPGTKRRSEEQEATVYEHELVARDGHCIRVEVASRLIKTDGRSGRRRGDLPRHQRAQAARRAAAASAETRSGRPARRRGRPRLQQPADRDQRLHRGAAREIDPATPTARSSQEIAAAAERAAEPDPPAARVQPPAGAAAAGCSTSTTIVAGSEPMLRRLIGEDVELVSSPRRSTSSPCSPIPASSSRC